MAGGYTCSSAQSAMTTAQQKFLPLPALLAIISLALWFFLGFPWQLHNESLIWDISLRHATIWDALFSNPVPTVQTYRPLGMLLAWLTFHLTGGGVWLQQLCNFIITAAAWILALRATRNQLHFAFLSFACGAAYFSGYIYLFHLHGVFYGPLLGYLAYLLVEAQSKTSPTAPQALQWFAVGTAFALFHPFALLMLVGFIGAQCVQNLMDGQPPKIGLSMLVVVGAVVEIKLLTQGSSDILRGGPLPGLLATYRALEFNRLLAVLSATLAIATLASLSTVNSRRLMLAAVGIAAATALLFLRQPVVLAWIVACLLASLYRRQMVLASLVAVCGLLPIATGTGTPTYAVFVIMPCIVVTVHEFQTRPQWHSIATLLATVFIVVTALLWIVLRLEWQVPLITTLVKPLYAEREKTYQLENVFVWLDAHPQVVGNLRLCHPAEFPVLSGGAVDRERRAPSDEWAFDKYLQSRYGQRFDQVSPALVLCFGGEQRTHSEPLMSFPGKWAGVASIQQLEVR